MHRITPFTLFLTLLLFISYSTISSSQQEIEEMRSQIHQAEVRADVDAPKGQDLSRIMEEVRANYERLAVKNQEELKAWHESQVIQQA